MRVFLGPNLSVTEMIQAALADDSPLPPPTKPSPYTAADNIRNSADFVQVDPPNLLAAWRFAIMQTLDDYQYSLRLSTEDAAQVFKEEPMRTHPCIDAAIAGLAEYLANRDGWTAPTWSLDPTRVCSKDWYVAGIDNEWCRNLALTESPDEFRSRGVLTTMGGLTRV